MGDAFRAATYAAMEEKIRESERKQSTESRAAKIRAGAASAPGAAPHTTKKAYGSVYEALVAARTEMGM